MPKPKTPNQRRKYAELNKRLARYVALVEMIYENFNAEAARLALRTGYSPDDGKPFRWADYPQTKGQVDALRREFVEELSAVIERGTSEEWQNSNEVQDLLADGVLRAYGAQIGGEIYQVYYQTNSDALKAFQQRKDKGLNISDKLWNQSSIYRRALEEAISCAIAKGTSAVTLSKQISQYLNDFPSLRKDYKDRFGRASRAKDCEYRSIRLARSEINMAYRQAENLRWQQMHFVVGYEIKLSGSHPKEDICDRLKGKYPKDFVWTGWHPNDLCYKISILKTEEEFWAWDGTGEPSTDSVNRVDDVPDGFKQWIGTNSHRIEQARKRGTLPYFIRDNQKTVDRILKGTPVKEYYMPSSVTSEDRNKWIANATAIESKLGLLQGKPMTFGKANELRGNINYIPKVIADKNGRKIPNPSYTEENYKYHINCQSCVVANELRRRGYDVTALPNTRAKDNIPYQLSLKTELAWIDPATGKSPKKTNIGNTTDKRGYVIGKAYKETMHDLMDETKEPGRYHVNFAWKKSNHGHIITFERMKDGSVRWYDPQTGDMDFFNKEYYNRINAAKGIKVVRVDNLLVNTEIINGIVVSL